MSNVKIIVRNNGPLRVEGDGIEIVDQDGKAFGLAGRTRGVALPLRALGEQALLRRHPQQDRLQVRDGGPRPAPARAQGLIPSRIPRVSPRTAGVLLHPTSLPGPYGIGDLGPECFRFLDFLKAARQGLWQVLPLGPTGYGDSPYQCFSAFAGNPLLVSLDRLVEDGLLVEVGRGQAAAIPRADRWISAP